MTARAASISVRARGSVLRQLLAYLLRERARLLPVLLCAVFGTLLLASAPYLIGRIIDGVIAPVPGSAMRAQYLLLLAVYVAAALCNFGQTRLMAAVAQRGIGRLRDDLFAHLQRLPVPFFDRRPPGELMSRVTNDMELLATTLNQGMPQLLSSAILLLGTAAFMLHLSPALTLLTVASLALMFTVTRLLARHSRAYVALQQNLLGQLNGQLEEDIGGLATIRLHNAQAVTLQRFDERNRELRGASIRAQIFAGIVGPCMNSCNNLGYVAIVAGGGWLVWHDLAGVGLVAAFLQYARQLERPVNEFANQFNLLQSALAAAERGFAILAEPVETGCDDDPSLARIAGAVEFECVAFAYTAGQPVLRDVSLRAVPGQHIALVGPTGAGKTTLFNLLLRFIEPCAGTIRIDARDTRTIDRQALRRQLGVVLQEPQLFEGSVLDNIRYARPEAELAEVERIVGLLGLDDFIARLPEGYATPLRAGGSNLSQGQRQLLSIARTLLADPAILLLDEATSHLDARSETQVQRALRVLMRGRTCLIIAHRLRTISGADQILLLDGGAVVERGSHAQLLAHGGVYAQLWTAGLSDQDRKFLASSSSDIGP